VWTILHRAGVDPAPQRAGPTWPQLLTAQAKGILPATSRTWTPSAWSGGGASFSCVILLLRHHNRSAALAALGLGRGEPGQDASDGDVPLELSDT
jgi:hypothetical protein